MPTPTYVPLATKTLTGVAAFVTFSLISQSYRDLVLLVSNFNMDTGGTAALTVQVNGLTTSIYNYQRFAGQGGSGITAASQLSDAYLRPLSPDVLQPAGGQRFIKMDFFDYSTTDKKNTGVYRYGNASSTNGTITAGSFRIESTAAITSIKIASAANNFTVNSVFTLYGIAA